MNITFTNIFRIGNEDIAFAALSKKEQERVANHTRREPLTNLGEVKERQEAG